MRASCAAFQPHAAARRGFTLIEAALVTVIIGVGVTAMLELLAAGTLSNREGANATVAVNLARNIREMSLGLAFADPTTPTHWGLETGETALTADDIDDLDGAVFSPPIDAVRKRLVDLAAWEQRITVRSVDPNRLTLVVPSGSTPASQVTVEIRHRGRTVYTASWHVFDADQ